MSVDIDIKGCCPNCGKETLEASCRSGELWCRNEECNRPTAIAELLDGVEIHHIVRFDEHGHFNAKHPLRERIDDRLLDCVIHEEINRWEADGNPTEGTWRVKHRDDVKGEEHNEWPYVWERL